MSTEHKKTVYLGTTKRETFIYADIRLSSGDKVRTMTDHTTGTVPDVAISFTELRYFGNPRTAPDEFFVSGWQIQEVDRIIANRPNGLSADNLELIERAWRDDHLNVMNAACDHMTPEMLNPTPEQMADYLAGKPDADSYGQQVMNYRIDRVVCPETGYTYGHAWLAKAPANYEALVALIAEGAEK